MIQVFSASNSDRRRYGEGIIGKLFNRTLKRRKHLPEHVLKQLDDNDDFRLDFTFTKKAKNIIFYNNF